MPRMGPILLAVDHRGSAVGAIDAAAELARERGVAVEVLIVGDTVVRSTDGWEETAEQVAATLRARGVTATATLRHGVPADVILERAGEIDAALIVLGSTSRAVATRSPLPVLVVPQSSTRPS